MTARDIKGTNRLKLVVAIVRSLRYNVRYIGTRRGCPGGNQEQAVPPLRPSSSI